MSSTVAPFGHLGARVSALLDGQLSADDAERAWAHAHACHQCRDLVEREGWVKTQLAGWSLDRGACTPDHLKSSLQSLHCLTPASMPSGDLLLAMSSTPARSRGRMVGLAGIAALGSGAAGAAVVGVLALGAAPADAPTIDRRVPAPAASLAPLPQPARASRPAR